MQVHMGALRLGGDGAAHDIDGLARVLRARGAGSREEGQHEWQ